MKEKVKNAFRKYTPNLVMNFLKYVRLAGNYHYDLFRYFKFSDSPKKKEDVEYLFPRMIENYHALEKGLSLKNIKPGFGKERINELIEILELYTKKSYDIKHYIFTNCLSVLKEYINYHDSMNYDTSLIEQRISNLEKNVMHQIYESGGTQTIFKEVHKDFKSLVQNRHSVRNFTDEKVDLKLVKKSIELASKTPSSCNKQPSRVYIINNRKLIDNALSTQSGNRGFGHLVNSLLVVTFDIKSFNGAKNRNQGFIDAGMFAMSLIYSLEYHGLASCALNWAADKKQDQRLREKVRISENESVVMMIAVGIMPETLQVPKSQRLKAEDITSVLE